MGRGTQRLTWRVVGGLAGIGAAYATRKLLTGGWRAAKQTDPPVNPASPTTNWSEALTWAATTGVALGVARVVATRGAAAGWKAATGGLPPGLEDAA